MKLVTIELRIHELKSLISWQWKYKLKELKQTTLNMYYDCTTVKVRACTCLHNHHPSTHFISSTYVLMDKEEPWLAIGHIHQPTIRERRGGREEGEGGRKGREGGRRGRGEGK